MRIAVISDTHLPRFRAGVAAAVRHVRDEAPDAILHCGDLTSHEGMQTFEAIAPVDAVAGNNDGPEIVQRYGRRKIVDLGGAYIGMVHGDGANGTTLGRALAAFDHERVDAIVFGHSHVPYVAKHGDVWVVNPGSITDKRRQPRYSFAVLDIEDGTIGTPRLIYFDADEARRLHRC